MKRNGIAALVAAAALLTAGVFAAVAVPEFSAAPGNGYSRQTALVAPISRGRFGVNVATWDTPITDPGAISSIREMGFGLQQYPNDPAYNWQTNLDYNVGSKTWDPYPQALSLRRWGVVLRATGQRGIYIVDYGHNPSWTGGDTVRNVQKVTEYILQNHIPVSGMVIGSEEYGSWRYPYNLWTQKTAWQYAQVTARFARAIRAIDPKMLVGADFDTHSNGPPGPLGRLWNRTVLRVDAPYIQFLSIHIYPTDSASSNTRLLQNMIARIPKVLGYARSEIRTRAPRYASRIRLWATEFNPENGVVTPQTIGLSYGADLILGLLLTDAYGSRRTLWWDLYNGGFQYNPITEKDTNLYDTEPGTEYGTFGLLSYGVGPQPPANAPFPDARAYAQFMRAVGRGGTLYLWPSPRLVAAEIVTARRDTWFVVNPTSAAQTAAVAGREVSVPADQFEEVTAKASVPAGKVGGNGF